MSVLQTLQNRSNTTCELCTATNGLKVYTIPETPVLLLSDNGKMVRATLSQKADDDDI
jgi:protein PhnA